MILGLMDLVVPGAGPLLEALRLVCGAASEMQESRDLCMCVYEHLMFLHGKLAAMERKGTLPPDDILRKYTQLVADYLAFLERHRRKIWVYRIVVHKRVLATVRGFQHEISTLMFALSMCHMDAAADERVAAANERAQMAAFRRQQEQFLAQQQRVIEARLVDDATIAKEVEREWQQKEAISVFRYELQAETSPPSGRTAADSLQRPRAPGARPQSPVLSSGSRDSKVLHTALDKVMRRSSVRVGSVPDWFLPPHKVEYEAQAFARGSFGTVHYGTMGFADVVVKCLHIDTRGNESVTSKFRHEAGLWYTFRHNHVLTMYGACDVSSPPFIVCERAAHGNLFTFLNTETNRHMMFRLLRDAASGLAYLHEQRVVHGDLKCDNILVADGYIAKLADFGFSYVLTASPSSGAGKGVGSGDTTAGALRWRAPECVKGHPPTFASDIYSLGMCIIEAASQQVPWGHFADDNDVRSSVLSGNLPKRPPQVSDSVWTLVKRMCRLVPSDRPSLDCVIAELVELEAEAGRSAPPTELSMARSLPDMSAVRISSVAIGTSPASAPRMFPPAAYHTDASALWTAPSHRIPTTHAVAPASPYLENADRQRRATLHVAQSAPALRDLHHSYSAGADPGLGLGLGPGADTVSPPRRFTVSGTNVSGSNGDGDTALSRAAASGDIKYVCALLQSHRFDVNAKNCDGTTPLHRAAADGHVAVVAALLSHGARVSEPDASHKTPLHYSAESGHLECVRVLLEHQADVNARPLYGCPALHPAAERGHAAIVAALLQHGARVDEPDITSKTALHVAAWAGKLESVQLLLQHRANVHAQNIERRTPLNYAAMSGRADIVRVLVAAGARVDPQDVDDAKRNGHREIVALLQCRGPATLVARYG